MISSRLAALLVSNTVLLSEVIKSSRPAPDVGAVDLIEQPSAEATAAYGRPGSVTRTLASVAWHKDCTLAGIRKSAALIIAGANTIFECALRKYCPPTIRMPTNRHC